jgi:hypothetical protein
MDYKQEGYPEDYCIEKGWLLKIRGSIFNAYPDIVEELKFYLIYESDYDEEEIAVAVFPAVGPDKTYPDPEKTHEWAWDWHPWINYLEIENFLALLREEESKI